MTDTLFFIENSKNVNVLNLNASSVVESAHSLIMNKVWNILVRKLA